MPKCVITHCQLEAFENLDKCVLHCAKGYYRVDRTRDNLLDGFFKALIDLILDNVTGNSPHLSKENRNLIKNWLIHIKENSIHDNPNGDILKALNQENVVLDKVSFPQRDGRDYFDYLPILRTLKSVHFYYCHFSTSSELYLSGTEIFYEGCNFHNSCQIGNSEFLLTGINVIYHRCIFHGQVTVGDQDFKEDIESPLFSNCEFRSGLHLNNVFLKRPIFNDEGVHPSTINYLKVNNCYFSSRFILSNCKIKMVEFYEVEFEDKLELKQCTIDNFHYYDNNAFGITDFNGSTFFNFHMEKSIFYEFVGFENCEFGEKRSNSKPTASELRNETTPTILRYVTFKNIVNFRSTIFHSGLDIERANFEYTPNFLDSKVEAEQSNRETFRIIKNSFDSIGNHIEANRFFIKEMKKYKEEISVSGTKREKFILWINEKTSNFGQDYVLPIYWLVAFSLLYYILVLAQQKNWLYKALPFGDSFVNKSASFLNGWASHILPFTKFLQSGMEFLSLIFYIIFAGLIWQTIVAIKRHTRR